MQNKDDIAASKRIWASMPAYMRWKYEAEKNLAERNTFKWTILRPVYLTNEPGTGKASIGKTHFTKISVSFS